MWVMVKWLRARGALRSDYLAVWVYETFCRWAHWDSPKRPGFEENTKGRLAAQCAAYTGMENTRLRGRLRMRVMRSDKLPAVWRAWKKRLLVIECSSAMR